MYSFFKANQKLAKWLCGVNWAFSSLKIIMGSGLPYCLDQSTKHCPEIGVKIGVRNLFHDQPKDCSCA